jgi:hypothetical protein
MNPMGGLDDRSRCQTARNKICCAVTLQIVVAAVVVVVVVTRLFSGRVDDNQVQSCS